jgi:hypothetical protein
MLLIAALLVAMQQQTPLVPPYFDREAEEAAFRRTIDIAEIDATVKSERVVTTSPVELWRVVVEGRGDVRHAAFLLELISMRDWRVFDLESFHADGETFSASFVMPVFEMDVPTTREGIEVFEKLKARQRLVDARALLDAWPYEQPSLRLTGADLDDRGIRLRGVALGAAARAEVLARVRSAGFAVPRMQLAPSGACRPFVLTAERGEGPTTFTTDATLRSPLCDDGAAGPAAQRITARGTSGPLNASVRNIEIAEVFHLLHELTGENFILDPDVTGRVDLELEKATLEQALAAIPNVVIGPAPLHRVSRTPKPGLTQTYTGEPMSMLLSDADVPSVLCLFERVTGLQSTIAPDATARATIYARDVPWDRIMDAMLASAGLTYKIDGYTVAVGRRDGAIASCDAAMKHASRFTSAPVAVEQLARSDVEVAGVVQDEGKWKAILRGARYRFWLVEEGQKLFDAAVKRVSADGVLFE